MHILEAKNITKTFGGLMALNNVSFEIKENEIFGVIGPNGAGKTTLFNVITGFHKMDRGNVTFRNEDVTGFPPYILCKKGLTRTFQIVKPLKEMTVLENVMVGAFLRTNDVEKAKTKAQETLKLMGLQNKENELAKDLTVPDMKRLELARAVATDPVLLLVDEAFAGLNTGEVQMLINILRRIREQGVTLFIIEHVMGAIMSLAERIMVLDEGEKIAEGTPEEIQANEKVLEVYLGTKNAKTHPPG